MMFRLNKFSILFQSEKRFIFHSVNGEKNKHSAQEANANNKVRLSFSNLNCF